jgi:cyclophilin family peptidyl-prolyl cis-trans isomerase
VRVAAAQLLDLVLDTTAAAWTRAFDSDTAFVVQQAVALGAAKHGVSLDDVATWRTSANWQRRASTVDLDAVGPATEAMPRVERWLADPDGRVRAAAAGALGTLADSARTRDAARNRLQQLLADSDVGVRTTAREGLTSSAARGASASERRDSTGTARPLAWYEARAREASSARPIADIETERGVIQVALFSDDAPLTVFNFDSLARAGYFDGQRFHRVVPNFVVQAGDPRGDGNGGPGYAIRDELNCRRYIRGTLGMALSGPNTGGSQFFITHSPQPHLDGGYTVFGQLLTGGEVLDRIVQGDRIVRITIH